MYVPTHFQTEDPGTLEAFIRANNFGVLVSVHEGIPIASHLPFLYDRNAGGSGMLIGHMARGNPQWRSLANGQTVLGIFQGPHAYISPTWYASPGVPTWNYAVAHVYGKAKLVEEDGALWRILERLVGFHESGNLNPWKPELSSEMRVRMLGAIMGFEIEITEIQGKFKLNQNRSREDQRGVVAQLAQAGSDSAKALAKLMTANLDRQP
jgi:transcriptional regulator